MLSSFSPLSILSMSAAVANGVAAPSDAAAPVQPEAAAAAPAVPVDPTEGFFGAPRFAGLEWRVDVQRHSSAAADTAVPTAIVQIKTRTGAPAAMSAAAASTGKEQLLQFELDRDSAAHVLLQLEKIEAIMNSSAQ